MSQQQHEHTQTTGADVRPTGLNTGRRKLVRAGLAAAPVVAAFKSEMVLASGKDKAVCPSTFASFKRNGATCSVTAPRRASGSCVPMDSCKTKNGTPFNKRKFGAGSSGQGCNFRHGYGEDYEDRELWELCAMNYTQSGGGPGQPKGAKRADPQRDLLARYVSAAYISCLKHPGSAFITERQCRAIWEGNGTWQPAPGVTWSRAETLDYFETVYGARSFDKCLSA